LTLDRIGRLRIVRVLHPVRIQLPLALGHHDRRRGRRPQTQFYSAARKSLK
jgi:hypothetical protein